MACHFLRSHLRVGISHYDMPVVLLGLRQHIAYQGSRRTASTKDKDVIH
jgi:hypothetical protein